MCLELGKQCENCENDALHASHNEDDAKMDKLQKAQTRIRSAPSRSNSGAEPPAHKKPKEDPSPSPTPPNKNPILEVILELAQTIDNSFLKTDNMVLKTGLEGMQTKIESHTQALISAIVDPLKDKICDIHARLENIEKVSPSNQNSSSSTDAQEKLQNQIDALQSKIKELSAVKTTVAVIGGLGKCGSLFDAKVWLRAKCGTLGLQLPDETKTYCTGNWKGMLFAKFEGTESRDAFVSKLNSPKITYEDTPIWTNAEATVEVRACEICLSGLKKYWWVGDSITYASDGKRRVRTH